VQFCATTVILTGPAIAAETFGDLSRARLISDGFGGPCVSSVGVTFESVPVSVRHGSTALGHAHR
jgi:hypothetical protein